jgi:hypothetical protein
MENQINKTEAKNIAKVMIASTGLAFDGSAFSQLEGVISEDDMCLILAEIQNECSKIITAVSAKLNREIHYSSTEDIVLSMYFENVSQQ